MKLTIKNRRVPCLFKDTSKEWSNSGWQQDNEAKT